MTGYLLEIKTIQFELPYSGGSQVVLVYNILLQALLSFIFMKGCNVGIRICNMYEAKNKLTMGKN